MKKTLNLLFALAFCAGLCLPAFAQEETDSAVLSSDNPDASTAGAGEAGAGKEKPAPKKKKAAAKKAPKDQPPSLDDIDPNAVAPAGKEAAKKPAKKPAKKKKKVPPPSEYKFSAVDKTETYKFDKKANPIVKQKKKPAKKGAAAPNGQEAPQGGKLKPAKSFEDQSVKTGEGQEVN